MHTGWHFLMLSCSFSSRRRMLIYVCIEFNSFLVSGILAHWNTFVNSNDRWSSQPVQNPVLFNTRNMRNVVKLLPVGVVPYCQTGSFLFQVFQVHYRLIGLTQWESVLYVIEAQTVGLRLKLFFLFLSDYYPTFPFQSSVVCKDEPFQRLFLLAHIW